MHVRWGIGVACLVLAVALGCGRSAPDWPTPTGGSSSEGAGGEVVIGGGGGSASGGADQTGGAACIPPNDISIADLFDDPELRHASPPAELPVYVFSQSGPASIDPQLFEVGPALSLRTTGQWGTDGTQAEDYDVESIQDLQALGSRVILGLTASVVFESQFQSTEEFLDVVSRDAANQPVLHEEIVPDAYRGNLAHPKFRDLIVQNAKVLVDIGADGIFFDEANAGYSGSEFDGNEGFDDYHQADFRAYLCAKHPEWTPPGFMAMFNTSADNTLDCAAPNCVGVGFSLRRYLADGGLNLSDAWDTALLLEWGTTMGNRVATAPASFLQTSEIAYWADIVRRVRKYARDTYQRELLITSNGLFPFVDFQSIGLYPYNADAPSGSVADYVHYVPTTSDGHLDLSVSLVDTFERLRDHSRALAGDVPLALFIDWPTDMMDAYYAFSEQEKRDYFRIYGAEAYAAGLRFAWHLKTSMPDDPTATDSNMLDWFTAEADFYRQHADIYIEAEPSPITASTPAANILIKTTILADGSCAVHLINHAYDRGFIEQTDFTVTVETAFTEFTGTMFSPDGAEEVEVLLGASAERATFEVPSLKSYAVVVLR